MEDGTARSVTPGRHAAVKLVICSVITTLLLSGTLVFIARDFFIDYLLEELAVRTEPLPITQSEPDAIVATIAAVNDAVVSVVVTKDVPIYERYYENFNPGGWFGDFLIPRIRENGTREEEVGGGSGFIVSEDGLIVTNRHVVSDESARYSVVMNDGIVYDVSVLARDEQLDIALLKINEPPREPLPFLTFGDSNQLQLGETVIAIGNALAEFQNSVSVGVISGLSRSIVASDGRGGSEALDQVIQTDAAINPGNSGGPLLNVRGEVIGVNVATSQGADNIGFALPAASVKQIVSSVQKFGEIQRPFLGVRYQMITPGVKEAYALTVDQGAFIVSADDTMPAVLENSPAAIAGVQAGDVIVAIDGVQLGDTDLAALLRTKAVGQVISLLVIRGEAEITLSVTLERAL